MKTNDASWASKGDSLWMVYVLWFVGQMQTPSQARGGDEGPHFDSLCTHQHVLVYSHHTPMKSAV